MSTKPNGASQALPDRPNLRHLKDQAKDLRKAAKATSLADAQFQIARWSKLKAHVELFEEVGQLKQAIDTNDFARVQTIDNAQPGAAPSPTWLRKGWAAHVGR